MKMLRLFIFIVMCVQAVGMMTSYFEYIITSLDLHSIDLEDFKYGGTNITAFRLVDPHNPEVIEVINEILYQEEGRDLYCNAGCSFMDPWRK